METIQYKCPNCNGPLEYRADIRKFGCEYCDSTFTNEEVRKMFKDNENTDLSQNIDETAIFYLFLQALFSLYPAFLCYQWPGQY